MNKQLPSKSDEIIRIVELASKDKIYNYLYDMWLDMRGDRAELPKKFQAVIDAFKAVGIISEQEHELWTLRTKNCPGHDCCQRWCAYCGDIPEEGGNRDG